MLSKRFSSKIFYAVIKRRMGREEIFKSGRLAGNFQRCKGLMFCHVYPSYFTFQRLKRAYHLVPACKAGASFICFKFPDAGKPV